MHAFRIAIIGVLAASAAVVGAQQAPRILPLEGNLNPVHDPVIMKQGSTYYVFVTGGRNGRGVIPIRTSGDLMRWQTAGFVFPESLPAWTATEIPRANNAWAPDISFFRGRYHL